MNNNIKAFVRRYSLLAGLGGIMNGLFMPVMYVVLKDKGFDIAQIGALVLFSSLATIVSGVPSGIVADRFGRKQVFLIGELLFLLFAAGLMHFQSFPALAVSMVCAGLSAAMMSGSLDAIYVERLGMYGATPTSIQQFIATAGAYQMAGMFGGAIAASALVYVAPQVPGVHRFEINYLCVCLLMPLHMALTYFLIPARHSHSTVPCATPAAPDRLARHRRLRSYLSKLAKRNVLLHLMLSSALSAAASMSFEKFWQLKLSAVVGLDRADWIFGVAFAASMFLGMCGNLLSVRLCNLLGNNYTKALILTRVVLSITFVGMYLSSALSTFVVLFCLVFLIASVSASPAMALFHHEVADAERSTMLAVRTVFLQVGAVLGIVCATTVASMASLEAAFLLSAVIFLVSTLFLLLPSTQRLGRELANPSA